MISKSLIKLVRSLEHKKYRIKEGLFVAEGEKTVGDLLERFTPHTIFCEQTGDKAGDCRGVPLWSPADGKRAHCMGVTHDELRRLSFLQHPQQVLALFYLPDDGDIGGRATTRVRPYVTLVLDGVQDPGNLGTIIRTADWFGVHHIVCSEDTADAFAPKVVQASMGSLARVEVTYTDLTAYLSALDKDTDIYGTFLKGDSIYDLHISNPSVIVMGNEGKGISDAVARLVTRRITIPRGGRLESGDVGARATTRVRPYSRPSKGPDSLNVAIATAVILSRAAQP